MITLYDMSQLLSLQEAPLIEIKYFRPPRGAKAFFYKTSDEVKIRVAIWKTESIKGTIFLQSGRTEFIEKYYEVIEEFLDRGFCVAMFDWRGQGLSDRLLNNPYIGHVNNFSLYDMELKEIIDSVYKPVCPRPWIGMGHSMGGCLIASAAADFPKTFDLVILSAPMLSLNISKPIEILGLIIGELSKLGFRDSPFPQSEWRGKKGWHQIPFEENVVTSDKSRFIRTTDLIRANEKLAIGGITLAWAQESIKRTRKISKKSWAEKISSPTLLLSATKDVLVNPEKNKRICQSFCNVSIAEIEGKHELLMEKDAIRKETWKEIDRFLEQNL